MKSYKSKMLMKKVKCNEKYEFQKNFSLTRECDHVTDINHFHN